MRHKIAGNRFGRNSSWRKATVRDLAKATLIQQRIKTTEAKAKEARKLVDRLITLGKKGTLAHKRRAFSILCDHKLVSELFTKISVRFANRNGGYTRIIKLATNRRGDNAQQVFLELTEKEAAPVQPEKKSRKKAAKKEEAAQDVEQKTVEATEQEKVKKTVVKDKPLPKKREKDKGGGLRGFFRRKQGE